MVPEKSDGGAEGGKRWRREKAAAPEKPELGDRDRECGGIDTSLLFFFLLLVVIFCNCSR